SILVGGPGNDLLAGNGLANILMAGTGNDTLKGGVGYNEYDLVADGGVDTIYDVSGQGLVKINGKAYGAKTTLVSGEAFTWIDNIDGQTKYKFAKGSDNPSVGVLTIAGGILGAGQIVVNNFNLSRAQTDANGYPSSNALCQCRRIFVAIRQKDVGAVGGRECSLCLLAAPGET
ncbi:hypothetical protein ACNRBW_02480, partial [Ralstonia pseudosolanacearum]